MKKLMIVLNVLFLTSIPAWAQSTKLTSRYTTLLGKNCRTVKLDSEGGRSATKCGGVGNYSLLVLDDDNRMSLNVVTPDGKTHPLDLWSVVTKSFSTLGAKAEWRLAQTGGKAAPVALIVRMNANIQEDPDKPQRKSYLAVIKLTTEKICVTDKVEASANANAKARQLADDSAKHACLNP